ncbi:restriction endonuclease subunit S [Sulfurimonas sp. HSL-1656]|uniref:restriction endonuclease subunit S n=1 Tax=Thiomicrolovo subterrani TaxID=3131934 RepID=UPI0031F9A3BC
MSDWKRVEDYVIYSAKGITPNYVKKSQLMVLNQKCVRHNIIDYSFAQYTDDTKNVSEEKVLKVGDILFNSTGQGTAGRCAFVDKLPESLKVVTDSHMLVLRCKSYYEARCLNYVLYSFEKDIQAFMDGSTGQGELDKVRLFNLLISIPKTPETLQNIANLLSKLDTKIELNNQINTELEAMAKTLYDYWFIQFDFPDENGKPYKSLGGQMVYSETLKREIPKGWEADSILRVSQLMGGGTPSKKNKTYWDGNIPFFTPTDADNGAFILTTFDSITEEGLSHCSSSLFEKGTIFITARGSVGKTMIAAQQMAMNQSCYAFKPLQKINYPYLYFAASELVHYLKVKASGSVFDSIVTNDIKFTTLVIPSLEIIKLYGEKVSPLFEKILTNNQENQQLARLRDWLLPMLMNGQVKVQDKFDKIPELLVAEPNQEYGKPQ